jgi:hypothetical protein
MTTRRRLPEVLGSVLTADVTGEVTALEDAATVLRATWETLSDNQRKARVLAWWTRYWALSDRVIRHPGFDEDPHAMGTLASLVRWCPGRCPCDDTTDEQGEKGNRR